ncbi:hypothetical protein SAMD00023353_1300990 [Rosellinia necatrix]|uniref:Uncharacterized protein n=1 Tax=Rosellinia necatrix TaxID=77044 RepID=A0A1W2TCG0_ROSNE|nr:hypothetical protein SAMD00023353_1300990 [Rosellinia necatrix]
MIDLDEGEEVLINYRFWAEQMKRDEQHTPLGVEFLCHCDECGFRGCDAYNAAKMSIQDDFAFLDSWAANLPKLGPNATMMAGLAPGTIFDRAFMLRITVDSHRLYTHRSMALAFLAMILIVQGDEAESLQYIHWVEAQDVICHGVLAVKPDHLWDCWHDRFGYHRPRFMPSSWFYTLYPV